MAAGPRSDVVEAGVVAVYHCWSCCVRQAFLLGKNKATGVDYDHRRGWLLAMQRQLARLFAIEIGFHAEMENHMHLVLRTRPDIVETWSDEDVVRRWLTVTKLAKSRDGSASEPSAIRIAVEMKIPGALKNCGNECLILRGSWEFYVSTWLDAVTAKKDVAVSFGKTAIPVNDFWMKGPSLYVAFTLT